MSMYLCLSIWIAAKHRLTSSLRGRFVDEDLALLLVYRGDGPICNVQVLCKEALGLIKCSGFRNVW